MLPVLIDNPCTLLLNEPDKIIDDALTDEETHIYALEVKNEFIFFLTHTKSLMLI